MMSDTATRRIAELLARIDELEEEVRQLRAPENRRAVRINALAQRILFKFPAGRVHAPTMTARTIAILAEAAGFVRTDALGRHLCEDSLEPVVLSRVAVLSARRVLGRDAIETRWGFGYCMTVEGRAALQRFLDESRLEPAAPARASTGDASTGEERHVA
jgi:uncharacterized protein (DUF1810 family)